MSEDFTGRWVEWPKNVKKLANLLADASLYIGNDSGVSHLSGILGVPTIVFYKTTDPEVWGALGRKVAHIKAGNEKSALNKVLNLLSSENGLFTKPSHLTIKTQMCFLSSNKFL